MTTGYNFSKPSSAAAAVFGVQFSVQAAFYMLKFFTPQHFRLIQLFDLH